MLKIGICSSIIISNSISNSYHSPSTSTVVGNQLQQQQQQQQYVQQQLQYQYDSLNQSQTSPNSNDGNIGGSGGGNNAGSNIGIGGNNSNIGGGGGSGGGVNIGSGGGGSGNNSNIGGGGGGGQLGMNGMNGSNMLLINQNIPTIKSTDSIGSTVSINSTGVSLQYNSLSSTIGSPSSLSLLSPIISNPFSSTLPNQSYMVNQILFNCLCFHPKSPILYAAIRNEVHFYDIITKSVIGKLFIDPTETIRHLITLPGNSIQTPTFLLAFTQEGVIYLWDPETHKLQTIVHQLKLDDKRPITCKSAAPNKPVIFFSKNESKDIVVVDFHNKGSSPFKLKGHKKPISAIAHHPAKTILASCSTDGQLKIWDTRNNMSFLNFEEFSSYENTRNIEHSNHYFLVFEPTGKYLVMTGSSGLTLVYGDLTSQNPQEVIANGFICKGQNILSIVHHPQLPLFFVLSIGPSGYEELSSWEINNQYKTIVQSPLIPTFIPEINDSLSYLSKYSKPLTIPKFNPVSIVIHPTKNYFSLQLEASSNISSTISPYPSNINSQPFSSIRHINQNIYSINSYDHLNHSFPLVSKLPLPMGFFFEPENTFNYPSEITFFDGTYVKSYLPLNGITKKLIDTPIMVNSASGMGGGVGGSGGGEDISKGKKFLFNNEFQLFALIYDSFSVAAQAQLSKYLIMDLQGLVNQQGDGSDCVFIGNNQQILILGLDGKLAKVATLSKQGVSSFKNFTLVPRITSVHSTPLGGNKVVLYFCQEKSCLVFSKNVNQSDPSCKDNYMVDIDGDNGILQLQPNEKVFQIEWQSDPKSSQHICAILTNQRIIITNSRLRIINQIHSPPNHHQSTSSYFQSIFWLEWTLLYTTSTHLMYMTLQNNQAPKPISTLSISPIILSTILPDRMIFGYQGLQVPGKNETTVRCQAIGILECLIIGLLSLPPFIQYEKKYLSSCLQNIVQKLDYTRISKHVLDKLRERSFTDLAYSLSNDMKVSQSKQSSLEKFRMAWISKQYEAANRHLSIEFNRISIIKNPNDTEKRQFNKLKENMRDFGRECMNAGHYLLAKDCFQKLSEHIYLLQISILLNDRDSVIAIKRDAELRGDDHVLLAACDKYLNKQNKSINKVNPPVVKILPWDPTATTNVSMKSGLDYLSPINLNSIQRYYPISLPFSGASASLNGGKHKLLRPPEESWPPEDFKHSVAITPPRTLMSLVANRLSTKSHMSSTTTLRRSPSIENIRTTSTTFDSSKFNTDNQELFDDDSDDDSDSGADADVDSENEEDRKLVMTVPASLQHNDNSSLTNITVTDNDSNLDQDITSNTGSDIADLNDTQLSSTPTPTTTLSS
ncbi:hypothetical protein ACTFIW_006136 [Dictyostelium discoideum]